MSEPVLITHHGRPRLVLTSLEIYTNGRVGDGPEVVSPIGGEASRREAVLNQLKDCFFTFDADMKIVEANPASELYVGVPKAAMVGRDLRDIAPETRRSIAWDHFKRVLRTGEPIEFKARSTLRHNPTMRYQAFPCDGDHVGVIISNLSASEEAALSDRRVKGLQAALSAEGAIALARLNGRGGLEAIDATFTAMTGFTEEHVLSLALVDLLAPADRTAFSRALHSVVRDGGGKALDARFVPRSGEEMTLRFYLGVAQDDAAPDEIVVAIIDIGQFGRGTAR